MKLAYQLSPEILLHFLQQIFPHEVVHSVSFYLLIYYSNELIPLLSLQIFFYNFFLNFRKLIIYYI